MADSSILIPGYLTPTNNEGSSLPNVLYLLKDNYLSEYNSEIDKSIVRENLGVPSKDSVYSKEDYKLEVSTLIREAILNLLNMEDPYSILPLVSLMISLMVKTDGSTPFTLPQSGVDPQTDNHLTTKKYVDLLLREHVNKKDPHNTLRLIQDLLLWYVKSTDVYTKDLTYTASEILKLLNSYTKNDGSTPFRKSLIGVDPTLDSHLSTKRYVDKVMLNHEVEVDPHNFMTILNNRLSYYAKRNDVFDKSLTYSRSQIDSLVNKFVSNALDSEILNYKSYVEDLISTIYNEHYIKQDGSIPFTNPQKGVDAIDNNDLVTLNLLKKIKSLLDDINLDWTTSGPVLATVGLVEEGTDFPKLLSLLEIFDAIFYGQTVSINCPETSIINNTCPITVCIHGSTSLVELAELYQGEKLIATFTKEQFDQGCITIDSLPILEDTEFTFRVQYSNEVVHESSTSTKVLLPVFIGLLPKWKFANTITMEYLNELQLQDTEGTLNRFINKKNDNESISFTYKFEDALLRHPFIVIPENYSDLVSITTETLNFGLEAFDTIDMIPLHIEGVEKDVIYKIYVYRLALSSLNLKITYNFK